MEKIERNITLSDGEQKIIENSSIGDLNKMLESIPSKCEGIIERIQKMIYLKQERLNVKSKANNILELIK